MIDYELLWWNRKQCLMGASLSQQDDIDDVDNCIPFQSVDSDDACIITVGYLIAGLLFMPLSFRDLKVGRFGLYINPCFLCAQQRKKVNS